MTNKRPTKKSAKEPSSELPAYATLGPLNAKEAPSAEWLTEMMLKRVESATEDYKKLEWEHPAFSHDEIMLHEAKIVIGYYKIARLALDIDSGKSRDPFRNDDLFTEDEIENGIEFGSKHKRGWPEIVTGYDTRHLALKELRDWVNWELSPGPEWAPRTPYNIYDRFGMEWPNGDEWLKWHTTACGGWKSAREVYLLREQFTQYQALRKQEDRKGKKFSKKVLGATPNKKSVPVGKKATRGGKNTPSAQRRKS